MVRRTAVSALWFASVFLASEVAWSLAATPRALGPILAAIAAGFIWLDPFHLFHPTSSRLVTPAVLAALAPDARLVPR